jgi:hypothetical protein
LGLLPGLLSIVLVLHRTPSSYIFKLLKIKYKPLIS